MEDEGRAAEGPDRAGVDERPCGGDARLVAVREADRELDAGTLGRLDRLEGGVQVDGERLLDHDVQTRLGGADGERRMNVVRHREEDGVDAVRVERRVERVHDRAAGADGRGLRESGLRVVEQGELGVRGAGDRARVLGADVAAADDGEAQPAGARERRHGRDRRHTGRRGRQQRRGEQAALLQPLLRRHEPPVQVRGGQLSPRQPAVQEGDLARIDCLAGQVVGTKTTPGEACEERLGEPAERVLRLPAWPAWRAR